MFLQSRQTKSGLRGFITSHCLKKGEFRKLPTMSPCMVTPSTVTCSISCGEAARECNIHWKVRCHSPLSGLCFQTPPAASGSPGWAPHTASLPSPPPETPPSRDPSPSWCRPPPESRCGTLLPHWDTQSFKEGGSLLSHSVLRFSSLVYKEVKPLFS